MGPPPARLLGRETDRALHLVGEIIREAPVHHWRVVADGTDLSGDYIAVEVLNIRFAGPNCLSLRKPTLPTGCSISYWSARPIASRCCLCGRSPESGKRSVTHATLHASAQSRNDRACWSATAYRRPELAVVSVRARECSPGVLSSNALLSACLDSARVTVGAA
jgi:hypothetical protein